MTCGGVTAEAKNAVKLVESLAVRRVNARQIPVSPVHGDYNSRLVRPLLYIENGPMSDDISPYTWIVTRDAILGDSSDAVGKIGPRGARHRERFDKIIIHGAHFRLSNEQGEVQFTGYILGDYKGGEPLEDYGTSNGCTRIEYERDGKWQPLSD